MAFKNVSKEIVRAFRDACNRILENESKCGSDDHFVLAVAIDDDCGEVARVELYSEFDVAMPEYRVPTHEALQIVAKHLAYATWDHRGELEDRLRSIAASDSGTPLRWSDGKPMQMREEMTSSNTQTEAK